MNAEGKAKERLDPWTENVGEIQAILHIQRYEYAIKEVNGVVLEVGCGLGYGSKTLHNVSSSTVAFDISDTTVLYAKRKYPGPSYVRADAQVLPFQDMSFDSAVALEVIEHVHSGIDLLREIHRVLKNEGILILSTPNVGHLRNLLRHALFKKNFDAEKSRNPYHEYEYTSKELTRLLDSTGFRIEKKWGQTLTFPLVDKLPPRLCVNTGRFLPELSLHMIYKARKRRK